MPLQRLAMRRDEFERLVIAGKQDMTVQIRAVGR